MEEIIKIPHKRYTRKVVISVSVDKDLVEWLDQTAARIGSDRSKIICFALEQARNWEVKLPTLLRSLQKLGLKPTKKMKRALNRAAEKAEKKKKA